MSDSSNPPVPGGAAAAPPDAGPDDRSELLARCWDLIDRGVLAQSPRIVDEAILAIARSGVAEQALLARELAMQTGALIGAYRVALRSAFDRSMSDFLGLSRKGKPSTLDARLSLLGLDDSDVRSQVEQSAGRLRDLVHGPWVDLARRLQTVAGKPVQESELFLHPSLFLQAAADGMVLEGPAKAAMVRHLATALAPALATTYEAIERLLVEAGIQAYVPPRAAPVVRPATLQRNVPPTIQRDLPGKMQDALLGVDIEASSAAARRSAPPLPVPDAEVPELQPDLWGLREYVRLQELAGVHANVLFEAAARRLQELQAGGEVVVRDAPSRPLIAAMIAAQKIDAEYLRQRARGPTEGKSDAAPALHAPPGSREHSKRLIGLASLPIHKHIVQLAARIFARIERDRIIPEAARVPLVALRFPFMEVALLDPSVFVRPDHPARLLVNSLAAAIVAEAHDDAGLRELLQQVHGIVRFLVSSPGSATGAFPQALERFTAYLGQDVRGRAEGPLAAPWLALRIAEERESRAQDVGAYLDELLAGAPLDAQLHEFLVRDWARVLVETALSDAEGQSPPALRRMCSLVPDLIWSLQSASTAADRKRLGELVQGVLETLRDGVARIGWSGSRLKDLVEHLRQAHSRALVAQAPVVSGFSASTLRIRLDGFRLDDIPSTPRIRPFAVVEEAVHRCIDSLGGGVSHRRVQPTDAEGGDVLDAAQAEQAIARWKPGTWFDLKVGRAMPVRLEGFSASRTLALFSTRSDPALISLSHASLELCVRRGWIAPREAVPLVARAFRKLLSDLKRSAQAMGAGGAGEK